VAPENEAMKVHLNQIPPEGLHVEGEENASLLDVEDPEFKPMGPVRYSLEVGLSGSGLFATGTLAVDLELECVACLKKFRYPLTVEHFALQTELDGREMVDLTPFVREDILLNLPSYPHCDWNEEHVCEGARKTTGRVHSGEQPSRAQALWGELDKLKIKTTK
jgi:uncharacterized metal-binding protein YceD (DUF177 family)